MFISNFNAIFTCHRTNLKYEVRTKKGKAGSVQEIASLIQNYFCDGKTGRVQSGIVYCLSQRDCDDTADKLASMVTEVSLAEAVNLGPDILAGQIRGRLLVDVNR